MDERADLGKRDPGLVAVLVEEAQLTDSAISENSEKFVPVAVVGRAQGEGLAGPEVHGDECTRVA